MAIVFERMDPSGFARSKLFPDSPPADRRIRRDGGAVAECCSSSSTSSIGRNSDEDCTDGEDYKDDEAQSTFKGPLAMMESLEEVLPIRRGISQFYKGKSKSYTSLAAASSVTSIKEIAKADNAYTRKRRNLMATNHFWDKKRLMKKPIGQSKSSLALAMAMSSSELSCTSEDSWSSINSRSPPRLPPLHPQTRGPSGICSISPPNRSFSPWRSYSLVDLPECTSPSRAIPR